MTAASAAIRVIARGDVQGVGFRDATLRRARQLGVMGWVRNGDDGSVRVHAEGPQPAIEQLTEWLRQGPRLAQVEEIEVERVAVEGHEQFAIRGVSAGCFVVLEWVAGRDQPRVGEVGAGQDRLRAGEAGAGRDPALVRGFELRLEVDSAMRAWALPKGPSLDPAARRLALELGSNERPSELEGTAGDRNETGMGARGGAPIQGGASIWDRGSYEQGGRVPWPEALHRGHAVFVLHGHKLRGGFALQRTRPGARAQWLLIKRRDEEARPGSEIVAERI